MSNELYKSRFLEDRQKE